ncbi:hypothetical protein [Helicobacter sp. 13S00482-2]|uniref:hypothetical protein n=1 Tax=Helicobacter sp. 13S00482-2 TaxID=1476200 RepID=UPI001C5EAF15|nr:hypothetical protein [Helicobacter sp. 13S00482-2]
MKNTNSKQIEITQKELVNKMCVTQATMSRGANGQSNMPKSSIKMVELLIIEHKFNTIKKMLLGHNLFD